MVSMDQYLAELVFQDLVEFDEALEKALDKDYFKSLVEKRRTGELQHM
jgi:Tfp pilus assembly ATPase PilU